MGLIDYIHYWLYRRWLRKRKAMRRTPIITNMAVPGLQDRIDAARRI